MNCNPFDDCPDRNDQQNRSKVARLIQILTECSVQDATDQSIELLSEWLAGRRSIPDDLDVLLNEEKALSELQGARSVTDQIRADAMTALGLHHPKFIKMWLALPPKLQTGQDGIYRMWPDVIERVMVRHKIDADAAMDHLIHRVGMFAVSDKGKRGSYQWSPKTFFGDGHYDDDPKTWEVKSAVVGERPKIKPLKIVNGRAVG